MHEEEKKTFETTAVAMPHTACTPLRVFSTQLNKIILFNPTESGNRNGPYGFVDVRRIGKLTVRSMAGEINAPVI